MLDVGEFHRKAPGSYDRCVPLERTLELIPELRARYGITRIGDITRLDRIGIPTYCAIVPTSPAGLSVYNGKGVTKEAALASAVFEAAERQAAASPCVEIRKETATRVRESLDLDRVWPIAPKANTDLECVLGQDLLSRRSVLVPLGMVRLRPSEAPMFASVTSNGLASGNTRVEATYHALCELIERHAWSLYHVRCELLPRVLGGLKAGDLAFAPEIRMPSGYAVLDSLAERVARHGLQLRLMYLREEHLPPVMLASIVEDCSDPPMSHIGLGCSLSPAHAAIRAVTEAAQSRLTDIQGAREDTLRVDDPGRDFPTHTRRLSKTPKDVWFYDLPTEVIDLTAITDASTDDLAQDLRRVLSSLRDFGASCALIVDLSPPDLPLNVVRAIVPELETTCVDGRMSERAREALNPFSIF